MQLPKIYSTNYSFGETINEIVAQNKADKLAKDLQDQKLAQEMNMETQRNMLALKMQDVGHQQTKEITYMQQAENQIDRDFNAKLKDQMNTVKMDWGKYVMNREEIERTRDFMRTSEWEEDMIEKRHKNQVSINDQVLHNQKSLGWDAVERDKIKTQNDFDIKLDFLTQSGVPISENQALMNEVDLKHIGATIKQSHELGKLNYLDALEWNNVMKSEHDKAAMMSEYYKQEMPSQSQDKAWSKQLGNWTSELIGDGFNVNEWDSKNTALVYNKLATKMQMIETMMKEDPRGDRNPFLWQQLRTQVTSIDQMLKDAGMGGFTNWMKGVFGGNKRGLKIKEMLKKMEYMLSGQINQQQQQQ